MDPIRIEGLTFAYGEGELRRPVLRDVTLRVHAGEVVLLIVYAKAKFDNISPEVLKAIKEKFDAQL